MLTPTETAQARTRGIRLRLVKAAAGGESGAQGLLATSWDRGKDVLNGIGAGAKGSVYAGIYAGVPAGMLWFALDRVRKLRTQKEREKEQELTYYKDYLQSVGAE